MKIKRLLLATVLLVVMRLTGEKAACAAETLNGPVYLPILMYHQILNDHSRSSRYVITADEFENDLKLLQKNGYTTITIKNLIDFSQGREKLPEKPVMLTFDDGYESDYVYAFPLLQKYNERAVFSIIGKYADLYSGDVTKHISYSHLNWTQIKEMHESGLAEFHNHSYDLHDPSKRRGALKRNNESYDEYEKMIANDFKILNDKYTDHVGMVPTAFTCPMGYYNDSLKQAVKHFGYTAILTSYERVNVLNGNPEELYGLGRFVREPGMNMAKLIKAWEDVSRSVSK